MTLGQEFEGFAVTLDEERGEFLSVMSDLCEISLGGTAIGTGIAADPRYASAALRHLTSITGYPLRSAANLIEATTDAGAFMKLSAALKHTAVKLSKICNDLRLLSSGPQAGLGEINLPARQAGSSIMPGKVNPVIPEVVNEVAFAVIGGDTTLTIAAEAGQLQLNAFVPVIAHVLFENLKWLTAAIRTLREHCVRGITANTRRLAEQTSSFIGVITALIPHIGYGPASRLAAQALEQNADIVELVVASGMLTREQVLTLLTAERLTGEVRKH
jgi:aspartate ammonia-lyase